MICRKHRHLVPVSEDPDAVFQEIAVRRVKFVEAPMEWQMRVLGEFDDSWKAQETAHQFEAVFEEAAAELELAGLAKSGRELLYRPTFRN